MERIESQNRKLKELSMLKDNLMHMVIHDLNNPLATITLSLSSLKSKLKDKLTGIEKKSMENTFISLEDMLSMTNTLLEISKMEEGKIKLDKKNTSIEEISREVVEQLQTSAGQGEVSLVLKASENIPRVPADKDMIKRVIANLINNALKFTPPKGSVSLEIFYKTDEAAIYVRVRDSGCGIPKKYSDKIFDKFFQGDTAQAEKGHGLGLTFCKLMVEEHGGKIWAESGGSNKGSTFTFTLPALK